MGLFDWFDERDARNNPALPPQRQRIVLNPPTDREQPMRPLTMDDLLARGTPPPADNRTVLSPPPLSVPPPVDDRIRLTTPAIRDQGDMPNYDASYDRPVLKPLPQSAQSNDASLDTSDRPRLVPPTSSEADIPPYFAPNPNATPVVAPTPLETDRIKLRQLMTDPVKKPTGLKGHLLEGLREAVIGAGHAWDTSQGDPRQRLGSAIGGAFGAGIGGAIDTGHNNERVRLRGIADARQNLAQEEQNQSYTSQEAKLKADTEAKLAEPDEKKAAIQQKIDQQKAITQRQMTAYENRKKMHEQDADVKAGKAKIFTDANGKDWKQFLQADSKGNMRPNEPVINPTTGEQEFNPGEQMVDWQDPNTGAVVKVKAKTTVMPSATIASGNAKLTQQGDEFNVTNERQISEFNARLKNDWQERNTKAENDWHNRNAARMIEIAKAGAGANPDTQGIYQQMLGAKDRMQQLVDAGAYDSKAFLEAQKEFWNSNKSFQDAMSKQANGQQVVKAMQDALEGKPKSEPEPKYVKSTRPIQAAQVGGGVSPGSGKILSKQAVQQAAKDHKISYETAAAQAEAQGYKIQ